MNYRNSKDLQFTKYQDSLSWRICLTLQTIYATYRLMLWY